MEVMRPHPFGVDRSARLAVSHAAGKYPMPGMRRAEAALIVR
jgi:hypothetical protein